MNCIDKMRPGQDVAKFMTPEEIFLSLRLCVRAIDHRRRDIRTAWAGA